jgi:hypothetical protein
VILITLNIATIRNEKNHLSHNFLSLSFSLTSYIGIIQAEIESASKILKFLCQEILTKLLVIFVWFGTRFAMANIMPKLFGTTFADTICSKSLWGKHLRQIRGRDFAVSPYAVRVYVKLTG